MKENKSLNGNRLQGFYQSSIGTRSEPKLRKLLDTQSKSDIEKRMIQLGLPIFRSLFLLTSGFLENPTKYSNELHSKMFFVEMQSSTTGQKKRDFNLTLDQVIDFTSNHIPFDRIILKENYYNIFSGTIVVRDKKDIYMEMVDGAITRLLHNGEVNYTATTDNFLPILSYDFDNDAIKQLMVKTLQYIPSPNLTHEPIDFNREFLPGYYEFIIVDKEDGHGPQPVFNDYNNNPAFTNVFRTETFDSK